MKCKNQTSVCYTNNKPVTGNITRTIILAMILVLSLNSFSQIVLIEKESAGNVTCTKPPAKPSPITGTKYDLCGVASTVLSINPVTNATGYTWTVPAGFTILADNGTSITVGLPAVFGQALISVTANNDCGISIAQSTNIFGNPSRITAVTGPACVLPSEQNLVYSIVNPEAGTTYTWYPPGVAKVISGQGTSTVTVNWRTTSGVLGVRPFNACGMNSRFNYYITVNCTQTAKTASSLSTNISVYPNPVLSTANVLFSVKKNENYTIKISDMDGRLMTTKQGIATAGSNTVKLDMTAFKKGFYIVALTTDEGTQVTKLMR